MKKYAIVFITTEGIQHISGGVAHYTSNFIKVIASLKEVIFECGIDISVFACEPSLLDIVPTYKSEHFEDMKTTLKRTGGDFFGLVNNSYGEDWIGSEEQWKILSSSAATLALNISQKFDHTIVLYGSSCFAMTQVYIHKQKKAFKTSICTVYLTHDSAFSSFFQGRNENVLVSDFLCAQWTNFSKDAKIGYVSNYMRKLFEDVYQVKKDKLIDCTGGILIQDKRFGPMEQNYIESVLKRYNIPCDKKLVFSWGRPEQYKRYDLLFQGCSLLDDDFYPVVVNNGDNKLLRSYIERNQFRGILIENYKAFELINGLVSWKNTLCSCFFSDNEPGAVTPIEAMYMSYRGNGVVLVKKEGHFDDLIEDGVDGFKCNNKPEEIAEKILQIRNLSEKQKRSIQEASYKKVTTYYNQGYKYIDTLSEFIPEIKKIKKKLKEYFI